ncbi:hypothetical protein K523DRAFT_371428 [Schizophyllum commune Tattone D]|nr:hypothetical protein K523DRAFT_371428 [Schizophyllum commune Tattone D]
MASVDMDTRATPRTPTKALAKTASGRSVVEDAENIYVPSPEVERYPSVFGLRSNYGSDFEISDTFTSSDGSPIPPARRALQTISPSQSLDSIPVSANSSPVLGGPSPVLAKPAPLRAKKGLARTETIVMSSNEASGAQGGQQRQLPSPPKQQVAPRALPSPPKQQLSPPKQQALPAGRYLVPSKQSALPAGRFLVPAKQFQPALPATHHPPNPPASSQPQQTTNGALAQPRPIRPYSKPTLPPGSYPVPTRPAPPPPADKKVKRKPVAYPPGVEPVVEGKGEGEKVHHGGKGELGGNAGEILGAVQTSTGDILILATARDPVFTRPTRPKPVPPFPSVVQGPVFTRPDGPLPPLKIDATSRALLDKVNPPQPAKIDTNATFSPPQTSSPPRRRPLPPLPAAPPSSPVDGVPPSHLLPLDLVRALPWSPRDIEASIERARRAQLAMRVNCASKFDEPCGCPGHARYGEDVQATDSGEPIRVPGAIHKNISAWARSVQAGLAPEDAPEMWADEISGVVCAVEEVHEDEATDVEDEQEHRDEAPHPILGNAPSPALANELSPSLDNGSSPSFGHGAPTWGVQPRRPAYDFSAIARSYLSSAADGRSAVGADHSAGSNENAQVPQVELGGGIAKRGPLPTIVETTSSPADFATSPMSDASTEPDSIGPSDTAYDASMSSNQESPSEQGSDRTLAVPRSA